MPPETETSPSVKSVEDSESVNVRLVVSPAFKEETSDLAAIVGGVVSLVVVLEACVAELPARSLTSAVMVRLPSSSVERSTDETE